MMNILVKVKSRNNRLGIIRIPSKFIDSLGHKSLNNVILEDGTYVCVGDQDLEVVNDWSAEVEE